MSPIFLDPYLILSFVVSAVIKSLWVSSYLNFFFFFWYIDKTYGILRCIKLPDTKGRIATAPDPRQWKWSVECLGTRFHPIQN